MSPTRANSIRTIHAIREREAAAAELLDVVKYLPSADAAATLRADAERAHAAHPQYRGFWDKHRLGRATTDVRTKMGVAFQKGDLCLFSIDTIEGKPAVSAYSHRTGCNTLVSINRIVAV